TSASSASSARLFRKMNSSAKFARTSASRARPAATKAHGQRSVGLAPKRENYRRADMKSIKHAALAIMALVLATPAGFAQKYELTESKLVDSCFQVVLTMKMENGKISVQRDGKKVEIARAASARHEYVERVLDEKDGAG